MYLISSMFLVIMAIPIVGCFSLYIGTGGELKGLPIGIVNEEFDSIDGCSNKSLITTRIEGSECYVNKISCRFIDEIHGNFIEKVI